MTLPLMKTLKLALLLALTLVSSSRAEEGRFFRIAGPVATTFTAFSADGYVTWTNAPTNATFTVQTASSLLCPINWVDYVQVSVTNAATTHQLYDPHPPAGMAFIPAGSFTMGDTFSEGDSDEVPLHTIYASAFYMDKYEVTKALWDDVYNWATRHGYSFDNAGFLVKAANHPVHTINWYDMVKWCNARSEKEGRVPAYYTSAAQTTVYRGGRVTVDNSWVKWSSGYRLPTEAEWEKAARGGASGHRFPWSDADTITQSRANYWSDTRYAYDISPTRGPHPTFNGVYPFTSPVGYFAANGYGLYDMAGNVWEWCWDWYDGNWYSNVGATQNDTRGPGGPLSRRVLRGGSWYNYASSSRCALRSRLDPSVADFNFGFRCVRGF